jgi:hypothetical protein
MLVGNVWDGGVGGLVSQGDCAQVLETFFILQSRIALVCIHRCPFFEEDNWAYLELVPN